MNPSSVVEARGEDVVEASSITDTISAEGGVEVDPSSIVVDIISIG